MQTIPNTKKEWEELDSLDSFDSYYECITACYGLDGEDVECITECVAVHLRRNEEQSLD